MQIEKDLALFPFGKAKRITFEIVANQVYELRHRFGRATYRIVVLRWHGVEENEPVIRARIDEFHSDGWHHDLVPLPQFFASDVEVETIIDHALAELLRARTFYTESFRPGARPLVVRTALQ